MSMRDTLFEPDMLELAITEKPQLCNHLFRCVNSEYYSPYQFSGPKFRRRNMTVSVLIGEHSLCPHRMMNKRAAAECRGQYYAPLHQTSCIAHINNSTRSPPKRNKCIPRRSPNGVRRPSTSRWWTLHNVTPTPPRSRLRRQVYTHSFECVPLETTIRPPLSLTCQARTELARP